MESLKKKVLFVITYLELGGAQKQLLSLIEKLDRDRYSLYLFAGDYGYIKKEFADLPYLKVRLIPELVRALNPFYDLIAFIKLYLYIKVHKFDIVHAHSPKASILARWAAYFAGIKNIIYTVHGWPFHKFMNPVSYKFFLFLERLTAKITKRIIVVSKEDLKTGIEKKIASQDKFILIHYGVDIESLEGVFLKRKEAIPSNDLIVNISSLKPQKGFSYFLKMARLILDKDDRLKFFIFGDGPLRKEIVKAIEDYNFKDRFLLKGWTEDMVSVLSRASLLVLTSLWEGLPLAVIEAVAAGVPVVVTDTGGVLDIVENYKNGIIVEPKDVKRLSEAVFEILDNYGEWLKRVESFRKDLNLSYWSHDRMVRETDSIYEAL